MPLTPSRNNALRAAAKAFGLAFGTLTLASAGLSLWFSTQYWGYPIRPPAVPKAVGEFDEILSITTFSPHWEINSQETNSQEADEPFGDARYYYRVDPEVLNEPGYMQPLGNSGYFGTPRCDTELCSPTRVLVKLAEAGLLSTIKPRLSQPELNQLTDQLLATELLLTGQGEYDRSLEELNGLIVEATDEGERYLLLALNGGQVENDHYPHYQMLFQQDSATEALELIDMDLFFYDLAGIEGLDFWVVWLVLMGLSLVPSLAIAAAAGFWTSRRDRLALSH